MEIVVTIKVGGNDPIEIKVDVPEKKAAVEEIKIDAGEFAVWFDEGANGWTKNPELNRLFLIHQECLCNGMLLRRGYLFLNEVYDCLGLPRTKSGRVVGWIYNEDRQDVVDFGIHKEHNADFINGKTPNALLDFNVEGNILDYL